jgi:hypothetical protein
MKILINGFLLTFLFFSLKNHVFAQNENAQKKIEIGLELVIRDKIENAWSEWSKDSYLKNEKKLFEEYFKGVESAKLKFGKNLGFEKIKDVQISKSYYMSYYLWRFDQGCLFVCFRLYKSSETSDWIIVGIEAKERFENLLGTK